MKIKTIIMAGGKGTRLSSIARDIPKPMAPICGKPILEHELICLKENGLTDIIIITGYLGETITNYFGDGSAFGCDISYYNETTPLGTAGALYKIKDELSSDFILLNGDIIFNIDFSRIINFHKEKNALVTLAVHPNNHPFDSAILITDTESRVTNWLNKEEPRLYYKNQVNSGIHVLSKNIFANHIPQKEKVDLDRDILKPLVPGRGIFAYHTPEYVRDAGTPERFYEIQNDIESGETARRNLSQKQKAVFLDRDGTINKLSGFIYSPEDFELLDGAARGIKEINRMGYLAIIITNQPVIARGEASFDDIELIHNKLETDLGKEGAYLDDIFFCPHHPDKGFPGERPEYKIDCSCRKPKPGMILRAAKKYNIDLAESYMAGDDKRDINAALAAGCRPVFIGREEDLQAMGFDNVPCFSGLEQFAVSLKSKG